MELTKPLDGELCRLLTFNQSHNLLELVMWLNDPEVNQFLEARFATTSLESQNRYIDDKLASSDNYYFAIEAIESGLLIGSLSFSVDKNNGVGVVGILIGRKDFWGKGYGKDAIKTVCRFGLQELGLSKITAGILAPNLSSIRLFEKCGFQREAVLRKHAFHIDYGRVDVIRMSIFANESA